MTKHIYTILLVVGILFCGCQKPEIDGDEDKKETAGGKNPGGTVGGDNGGWADDDNPTSGDTLNVATFKLASNEEAVWVKGYIVGCATASGGYRYVFEEPFDASTSVLLADSRYEKEKKNTIAVQLKSGSLIREDLNLVDNPENLHRLVAVKGYKTTYLKLYGMKDIIDYELK